MSTTTTDQQSAVSLENKYCIDYKSPSFIVPAIVFFLILSSVIAGAYFVGKRGSAPKMQGGSSKGMISITDFLKSMKQ